MMTGLPYPVLGDLSLAGVDSVSGAEFTSAVLTGWDGSASTARAEQKPRSHGGWVSGKQAQSRHLTAEGLIIAPSAEALEAARNRLVAANSLEDTVLTVHGAERDRWMTVCREDEPLIRTLTPVSARYSIQMLAADPRRFGAEMTQSTLLPSSVGGLSFPCSFPLTFDAVSISGQVSLTNSGTAVGPVILRLESVDATPLVAPMVTHDGVGAATVWATSQTIAAGEFILVNPGDCVWDQIAPHDVLAQGQASRAGWITQAGWSGFDPGPNVWSFAAASGAGRMTVTATEAW
jgi:hypothetical protein